MKTKIPPRVKAFVKPCVILSDDTEVEEVRISVFIPFENAISNSMIPINVPKLLDIFNKPEIIPLFLSGANFMIVLLFGALNKP